MGFFSVLKSVFLSDQLNVAARFDLEREAISGTMSRFYLAKERKTGNVYGLKIVDMKKLTEVEARFKGIVKPTEGEIALQLNDPLIVKTYEAGETTKGENYLLMEFLGGGGLNELIAKKSELLETNALLYIRQMAKALQAVHNAGFIHRDICPRNYICTTDRKAIKLTDFGLTVPAKPPFTSAGNRTGTPNYMAPELVRRKPTDQRLDVFSFGVTVYEMLTGGTLLWPVGKDGRAALTHDTPPVPITNLRPRINPMLAGAVHKCIEPDVTQRFPSLNAFLQQIRSVTSVDQG